MPSTVTVGNVEMGLPASCKYHSCGMCQSDEGSDVSLFWLRSKSEKPVCMLHSGKDVSRFFFASSCVRKRRLQMFSGSCSTDECMHRYAESANSLDLRSTFFPFI